MPPNQNEKDKLFKDMSDLLHKKPVDDVIPMLITVSARALVTNAGIDMQKLARNFRKFITLLEIQVTDMVDEDAKEAKEATRQ